MHNLDAIGVYRTHNGLLCAMADVTHMAIQNTLIAIRAPAQNGL
jgi:hypothetical protein